MLQYNPSISGSLNITGSLIISNGMIGTVNGVDVQIFSSSINQVITGIQSTTGSQSGRLTSIESFTSSTSARLNSIETITSSASARLNSIETISASNIARISSLETKSASVDTTNTTQNARLSALETTSASVDILNTTQNTRLTNLENKTGSLATTGSNTFIGTQIFSGSLFVQNNLVVQGSSSLQNITASAVSIGTNTVLLNTNTPSIRFAGISAIDSGSAAGTSGSLYFDSVDNEWIFIHQGNLAVTSSTMITGPETYDNVGNETRLTTNIIPKSTNSFHITDSCLFDNGTTTCVKNNLIGTGTATFSSCIIAGGDTIVCNNNIKTFSNSYGSTGLIRMYGTDGNEKYQQGLTTGGDFYQYTFSGLNHIFYTNGANERMRISTGGNIGINTTTPNSVLHIEASNNTTNQFRVNSCDGLNAGLRSYTTADCAGLIINHYYAVSGNPYLRTSDFVSNQGDAASTQMRFFTKAYNANAALAMFISSGGCIGVGTGSPNTILHTTIQTCYGTNGTVLNSYPIATFSQCDCAGGLRGLEIGVPTGGIVSPVYLKVSNTGARFSILDSSNNENLIITGGKVGINHTAPEHTLHVCINCASTGVTIAQFENKDYTAGTRSYARVRGWLSAGGSYSSYFGQGQDGKTYIYANNTARCGDIVIDGSTGYVGVGTNVPTLQMHIHSTTSDYNTVFSTSCVCGRAGWVIARPGSTSAVASALVLAFDCSFRLGNASTYNIKMGQDGSTSILNTSECESFKVTAGGSVNIGSNSDFNIHGGYLRLRNTAGNATYGLLIQKATWFGSGSDYSPALAAETGYSWNFYTNGDTNEKLTITTGGCVYLGKGFGATNHRINLEKPQGCTILVVSAYSGASNDSVLFYAASGANPSGTATVLGVTTNNSTGRSISTGGTINASGGDYAEYMLKRNDTGCIAKGQIVGIDSCKLLTDKWSLANSFVIKSTDPSYVGGDIWNKHLGKRPEQTTDISDEEFAPILADYKTKLEEARNKVDRIAFSGQVPVIVSGSYNIGDYILPTEGPDDTIVGVACSLSNLTLEDYGKTVGRVWGHCLDKAWVAVKIG